MHPRTLEVLAHLDVHRQALTDAFDAMPPEWRGTRPAEGRWSAADVLEHLLLVETQIVTTLATRIEEARAAGLGTDADDSSIMDVLDLPVLLDRTRRLTAGDASQPTGARSPIDSWDALMTQRERTRALLTTAEGLALGEVSFPHRRLGVLNGYQWLLFLGAHEGRHAAQIREVSAELSERLG